MRWTGWTAVGAGLLALAGCGYGYRAIGVQARYSTASRPDPSYFCYDCHGSRYFDPYYDYCDSRGFRYRWAAHPRSMKDSPEVSGAPGRCHSGGRTGPPTE